VSRWGSYSGAALIHDWLYDQCQGDRADADRVLLAVEQLLHPRFKMPGAGVDVPLTI
jgi:hypothetical protein